MSNFADLSLAWYNSPDFVDMTDRQRAMFVTVCAGMPFAGVRELAERLRVAKPVITRAASTMEHLGLLKREPCSDDGRRIQLVPTERGMVVFAAMREIGES